ncbi:hypothetical protein BDBG_02745 [Blastomyces gilchristii SLH14081]|uniref:Uncharacterized protein n=1 Tax=Blastomyces gilchristii (strain SLH14081) TaxID=559298 RepID=A0A179UH50_BLAGS|nr:uncharacterized protein BDBG_02745 [Blastomyces gilchristii SLH14081]OAT06559.1 hypothetical protein BDBG_02745 [Blastomyces gilchristii SLH14081]
MMSVPPNQHPPQALPNPDNPFDPAVNHWMYSFVQNHFQAWKLGIALVKKQSDEKRRLGSRRVGLHRGADEFLYFLVEPRGQPENDERTSSSFWSCGEEPGIYHNQYEITPTNYPGILRGSFFSVEDTIWILNTSTLPRTGKYSPARRAIHLRRIYSLARRNHDDLSCHLSQVRYMVITNIPLEEFTSRQVIEDAIQWISHIYGPLDVSIFKFVPNYPSGNHERQIEEDTIFYTLLGTEVMIPIMEFIYHELRWTNCLGVTAVDIAVYRDRPQPRYDLRVTIEYGPLP